MILLSGIACYLLIMFIKPGLFTSRDPPLRPVIKGGEEVAHGAVFKYREWATTKPPTLHAQQYRLVNNSG